MAKQHVLVLLSLLAACASHAPRTNLPIDRQPSAVPQQIFEGQFVPTYPLTPESEFAPQGGLFLAFTSNDTDGLGYAIFEKKIVKSGFFGRIAGKQGPSLYFRKRAKLNVCFENIKFESKAIASWAVRVEITELEDLKWQWKYRIQTFVLPPSLLATANRTVSVIDWKTSDLTRAYTLLADANQGRTSNLDGTDSQPYSSLFNLLSDAIKNRPNFIESHGLACK